MARIAGWIILYLVGFDIAGVLACLIMDVISFADSNTSGYYALWLVLGILCGLFSYSTGGKVASATSNSGGTCSGTNQDQTNEDWGSREDSGKTGLLVILTTFVVLAALWIPCNLVGSWHSVEDSGFVPDNLPLTLTFFGAVFASSVFAHKALRPEQKQKKTA